MSPRGVTRLSRFLSTEPHLVEVGQAHVEGRPPPRLFRWSAGNISVALDGDLVWVHMRFGIVGGRGPMVLAISELEPLRVATSDWAAQRDEWPAWYESHGPPPYGRVSWWYRPPGGAKCRQLRRLTGDDEVRPRRSASSLGAGVEVNADILRVGEKHAPAEVQVGLRYGVVDGLYLDAIRRDARLWRGNGAILYFSPGDEKLVSELCRLARAPLSAPPG